VSLACCRAGRTKLRRLTGAVIALILSVLAVAPPTEALPPETLDSVVSVLPVWPNRPQGGTGAPPGTTPEGSGIVVAPDGLIATAWHVIEPAESIDVRLSDGRMLPAELVGFDQRSDIALLRVTATLEPAQPAPRPPLAEPVCAIGNAFGLGLSVSCGVVSALDVSGAGFNPVEDFVQTDAAVNPGSSGGALVDAQGRLVGMLSAIFASGADTNIGVNFAVSNALLARVIADLAAYGQVAYVTAGIQLEAAPRSTQAEGPSVLVGAVATDGVAAQAGVRAGDLLLELGGRKTRTARDAVAALALVRSGESVAATLRRDGKTNTVTLSFPPRPETPGATPDDTAGEARDPSCPYPLPVCRARQAVFPVESFDPLASAVRIGPNLLVTNRHVVADAGSATILTPLGPRSARVVPSAFRGDLAILQADGLPTDGLVLTAADPQGDGPFYAVGADIDRRQVRVFEPGGLLQPPAEGAPLGRLHVSAQMQPGVSGGALVDADGRLVAIAVGGGEGRFEALPASQVRSLLSGRDAADARDVQRAMGQALRRCMEAIDRIPGTGSGALPTPRVDAIGRHCSAAENLGQYIDAGRVLLRGGASDVALPLLHAAVEQAPNSVNARLALLIALQTTARFDQMVPHAARLLEIVPEDPRVLRAAVQAGVWGGDRNLAETALARLSKKDPRLGEAFRRFVDDPPPRPDPR